MNPITSGYHAASEHAPTWVPYVAGLVLGLAVLLSIGLWKEGIEPIRAVADLAGTTAGMGRTATAVPPAPTRWRSPAVFLACGIVFGALLSALSARRAELTIEHGNYASPYLRALLALIGGGLAGWAACCGLGSPLGRSLVALASFGPGAMVYLIAVVFGAWIFSFAVRRQWDD